MPWPAAPRMASAAADTVSQLSERVGGLDHEAVRWPARPVGEFFQDASTGAAGLQRFLIVRVREERKAESGEDSAVLCAGHELQARRSVPTGLPARLARGARSRGLARGSVPRVLCRVDVGFLTRS